MTEAPRRIDLRAEPWGLITALGAVGLLRPVLSIAGVYDSSGAGPLEKPSGPLIITALTAVVWLAAALVRRLPGPLLTLTLAGAAYGVLAAVMNLVLQPFLDSAEMIPPPGIVFMIIFSGLQGAVVGLIALGVQRLRSRKG